MEGGKINNRNSNIDMIRIVAMLRVVTLHGLRRFYKIERSQSVSFSICVI